VYILLHLCSAISLSIKEERDVDPLCLSSHVGDRMVLDMFPDFIQSWFIPLDASTFDTDSRTPIVEPKWTIPHTYVYNTCVTLTASVDPNLISVTTIFCWRCLTVIIVKRRVPIQSFGDWEVRMILRESQNKLKVVRPPLEAWPEDRDETINIKKVKRHIVQAVSRMLARCGFLIFIKGMT